MKNTILNKGFTLVELIIVISILSILSVLSFTVTSNIGERAIMNTAADLSDFIDNSKFNLIKFKGDNLDIFINIDDSNLKNKYLFSYISKYSCTLTGGLDSVSFYDNIFTLTGQTTIESAYFTGSLDSSINIFGFKKIGINFERINLDPLDNFKHDLYDESEYKYDIYQGNNLCSHIFVKKLINMDDNKYSLSLIEVIKSNKDFNYDRIRLNFKKNFIAKIYTGDFYDNREFYSSVNILISDISNNTHSFSIVN